MLKTLLFANQNTKDVLRNEVFELTWFQEIISFQHIFFEKENKKIL